MTKLWDVWYDYQNQDGDLRFPAHVHVVADTIQDAITGVHVHAEQGQTDIEVFSIKQESERVITV